MRSTTRSRHVLIGALVLLLVVPATTQAAFTTGTAEQQSAMFSSPLYGPLKIKDVRYLVAWDAMEFLEQVAETDAWFAAATAANSRILVAFDVSREVDRRELAPSRARYGRAIARFIARYGTSVSAYQPWNLVNGCPSQPDRLCRGTAGAKRAADYFLELKRRVRGKTIVALDLLDTDFKGAATYMQAFARYAKPGRPRICGLRNFSDTNRRRSGRTSYTEYIIKHGLPSGAELWLTATGGVAQYGSFEFDLQRQAAAVRRTFTIARRNPVIKRVYLCTWTGQTSADSPQANGRGRPLDAGLIGPDGNPRPAYRVAAQASAAQWPPANSGCGEDGPTVSDSRPTLRLTSSVLRLRKTDRVRVYVRGTQTAAMTVTIAQAGGKRVGGTSSGSYTCTTAANGVVALPLNAYGLELVRRHDRLAVKVTFRLINGSGVTNIRVLSGVIRPE